MRPDPAIHFQTGLCPLSFLFPSGQSAVFIDFPSTKALVALCTLGVSVLVTFRLQRDVYFYEKLLKYAWLLPWFLRLYLSFQLKLWL